MEQSQSPSVDGGEHDEDTLGFDDNDSQQPAKPGRKKNPSNQAARRDQNRIAQREFRLRKQQRIRDLEARVEILSGSKEETHNHSRAIIYGLMEENSRLRSLLRDLGGFLGDGLGGPLLAKTGWDMKQFQDFVSKADSDTAYESFVKAKNSGSATSSPSQAIGVSGATLADTTSKKRKRSSLGIAGSAPESSRSGSRDPSVVPRAQSPNELPSLLPTTTSRQNFASSRAVEDAPGSFTSFIDTFSSSAAAPFIDSAAPRQLPPPRDPFGMNQYPPMSSLPPFPFSPKEPSSGMSSSSVTAPPVRPESRSDPKDRRTRSIIENEPKKNEAGKLIKYHLDNYKRSPQYFLPTSLRPTLVQRTVPHDNLIDGIMYPEIRDRMILLKDRFDLAECMTMYMWSTIVHGDDVLAHVNWELGEDWLRTYGFLVDESVLASVNKWRRIRGDPDLTMAEINPDGGSPSS